MITKIVAKTGASVKDCVLFEAVSNEPISESQARKDQIKLGYDPIAFEFNSFKIRKEEEKYVATWFCWASCD